MKFSPGVPSTLLDSPSELKEYILKERKLHFVYAARKFYQSVVDECDEEDIDEIISYLISFNRRGLPRF